MASGCRGTVRIGVSIAGASATLPDERSEQLRYARASGPRPSAVSATEPASVATRSPSSGWANGAFGMDRVTPRAPGRLGKNGEDAANGWTAEHTSCTKPGRVSSAVRPPPLVGAAPSSNRT